MTSKEQLVESLSCRLCEAQSYNAKLSSDHPFRHIPKSTLHAMWWIYAGSSMRDNYDQFFIDITNTGWLMHES